MTITDEQFDKELMRMAENTKVSEILSIDGMYEILAEEWNNEILKNLEEQT